MKQGIVHSSQMVASGSPNWWSISQPPDPHHQHVNQSQHHQLTPPLTGDDHIQDLPETNWSQLLLGGLVGEDEDEDKDGDEDKTSSHAMMRDMQAKKLETWEQQFMNNYNISPSINISTCGADVIKQENSYEYGAKVVPTTNSWSQSYQNNKMLLSSSISSPKSCVTNTSLSPNNNMLDFSHKSSSGKLLRRSSVDPSSHECNSTATGGVAKKAKMIQHSSAQSTFKVRKEKLGDRITALHQLVSPFGKTDTASVLLEAIGYIRFLQNQIEALSVPYLGTGRESTNNSTRQHPHHHIQGNGNSLFPEDPGQLLNKKCIIERKAATKLSDEEEVVTTELTNKDLRSRGLCLVPISSMLHVGSQEMNNGADYWAPSFAAGNFNY